MNNSSSSTKIIKNPKFNFKKLSISESTNNSDIEIYENETNISISNNNPKLPKNYEFIKILGQGAFGQVIMAKDNRNNNIVAIKLQRFNDNSTIFEKEITNLKKISNDCDNLVCIIDHGTFYKKFYIVMNYIEGETLDKYLNKNKDKMEDIFRQLIYVVKKLHKKGFAHMDIKPDNIIINNEGKLFLVDLGISCFDNNCVGGSKKFLPPDLSFSNISVKERQKADVWAIALCLALILKQEKNVNNIYQDILNNKKPSDIIIDLNISDFLKKILSMLTVSKKRMKIFKKL